MIQHHQELQERTNKFNLSMAGQLGQIQKIYSTGHFICINLRFPGISRNIYLGRGGGYEGFWEGAEKPKSLLRVRDRYLDYLRKYLTSGLVSEVIIDDKDRIFILVFQRFGQKNYLLVFWSGRKSYFLTYTYIDSSKTRLFLSWRGELKSSVETKLEDLLSYFDEVGRVVQAHEERKYTKEISELLTEEEKTATLDKKIKKKENFLQKKIKNIKGDLDRVEIYHELEKIAHDPELNLAKLNELKKSHFTLKFKSEEGHFQKLNSLFTRIKKLKTAKNILEKRQSDTEEELQNAKAMPAATMERVVDKIIGPVWKVEKVNSVIKPSKGDIDEFILHEKNIGVGLSATGNDFLRSSWGKSSHLWFHLDGETSAHVVVKIENFAQLSSEELSIIASLLWDYSKKNSLPDGSLVPLLFTQIKNLKGIKGAAGAVIYKKEKHLSIAYLASWKSHVEKFGY